MVGLSTYPITRASNSVFKSSKIWGCSIMSSSAVFRYAVGRRLGSTERVVTLETSPKTGGTESARTNEPKGGEACSSQHWTMNSEVVLSMTSPMGVGSMMGAPVRLLQNCGGRRAQRVIRET